MAKRAKKKKPRPRARHAVVIEWHDREAPSAAEIATLARLGPGRYAVRRNPVIDPSVRDAIGRYIAELERRGAGKVYALVGTRYIKIARDTGGGHLSAVAFVESSSGRVRLAESWSRPGRSAGSIFQMANPSNAEAEYERFHWGTKAKRKIRVRVSTPRELFEIGKLRRVEYETVKKGERAVWYHDFERPFPSLTSTTGGKLGPIVGGQARVEPRGIVG